MTEFLMTEFPMPAEAPKTPGLSNPQKSRAPNLLSRVFGRLTVVKQLPSDENGLSKWECLCICGNTKIVHGYCLTRSKRPTGSCGCESADRAKTGLRTTHGKSRTPTYDAWLNMWRRCTEESHKDFHLYQNRTPPERWKKFENFLEDMGERPSSGLSLERVDNDKPYGPDNCVWATSAAQSINRSVTLYVEFRGRKVALKQLVDELGKDYHLVYYRLKRGWDLEKAIFSEKLK